MENERLRHQTIDKPTLRGHEKHCFIVMPYGRNPVEIRWFKGWYDVVIKPAVLAAGYEPKLSAAEEQPSAINDEIRAHLAYDPMVVVDLGGASTDSEPNPNVMYELGIRHALGLPLVMLAWKGQRLPFDVGNQRVIMEGRDLLDLEVNRNKLVTFIHAAAAGNYYKPMDAVGRTATLEAVSTTFTEESVLSALVNEVRDLKGLMSTRASYSKRPQQPAPELKVKHLFRANKGLRKGLYSCFIEAGALPKQWNQLLNSPLQPELMEKSRDWSDVEWKEYIANQGKLWAELNQERAAMQKTLSGITSEAETEESSREEKTSNTTQKSEE
jgi:hypothetical protein